MPFLQRATHSLPTTTALLISHFASCASRSCTLLLAQCPSIRYANVLPRPSSLIQLESFQPANDVVYLHRFETTPDTANVSLDNVQNYVSAQTRDPECDGACSVRRQWTSKEKEAGTRRWCSCRLLYLLNPQPQMRSEEALLLPMP